MVQMSPPFLSSLLFKVGSLVISITMLKAYSAVYLGIGVGLAFSVAWVTCPRNNKDDRMGYSLFYCMTNVTIVAKCPLENRRHNFKTMMSVSLVWLVWHYFAIITLMVWYRELPHLPHWKDTYLATPAIFYSSTSAMLLLGPLSIWNLWMLPKQVKAKSTRWGVEDLWNPHR